MARVLPRPRLDKLAPRTVLTGGSNGDHDPSTGRFLTANRAAIRHGLRSASKSELRRRNRRARGYMGQLVHAFADAGRPLEPLNLPLARKWGELETLRVDLYSALQDDAANTKLFDQFLAAARLQVAIEKELGMTPMLARQLRPTESDPVLEIQRLKAVNHE